MKSKHTKMSLLLSLCMLMGVSPTMVFADDFTSKEALIENVADAITLPNGEVREIPTVEAPNTPSMMAVNDASNTIQINSAQDLTMINPNDWYSGKTFEITADLDLSTVMKDTPEWDGFIKYFYGNMIGKKADGSAPVISGIPNNRSLIYGIIGGKIENLTFEHVATNENGAASFISFLPTDMNGANMHLTMKNIKVTGNISLTGSDQSNYSPFIYAAPKAGLTMEGCVNDANITGSIYGSVFHGYYALNVGAGAPYEFINCVNNGDITMQYAGMFFGNSSSLEGKVDRKELYLTIKGCKNAGKIRGTSGAKYFAAPVSEFDNAMQVVEDMIKPLKVDETRVTATSPYSIEPVVLEGDGALCVGTELDGFNAELNGDSITVTRPSNESAAQVDYYVMAVSAYTNVWNNITGVFDGSTDRNTVRQKIEVDSLQSTTEFVPDLKVYGFADWNAGTFEKYDFVGMDMHEVWKVNDTLYYHLDNDYQENSEKETINYVSKETTEDGKPAGGGAKKAEIVTIAAYKKDGTMIDNITVSLSGE